MGTRIPPWGKEPYCPSSFFSSSTNTTVFPGFFPHLQLFGGVYVTQPPLCSCFHWSKLTSFNIFLMMHIYLGYILFETQYEVPYPYRIPTYCFTQSFKKDLYFKLLRMFMSTCMYVQHHIHACCTWRSKEVCPLELELQGLKSHHLGAASQTCHLQKQQVLLSMEPSLQPSLCDILTVMNC